MKKFKLFFLVGFLLTQVSCLKETTCNLQVNAYVDTVQLEEDILLIDQYLTDNQITNTKIHAGSGIRYAINSPGTGENPILCDVVTVEYEGRLLDGTIFDGTAMNGGKPSAFYLAGLITGWQVGIPLIKNGGSITLYLPSSYGYGSSTVGSIPANSVLIFDITLLGIN
ncbi:MAG: FKBP-type peptidyl-prolyl cis-trans isomerase [Cyclobacteriaceae bacterium]|nr:FKBP-type peptidyl-prolyl cis-trans isomerase [Cyclobacteriaceae bacterium]